MEETFLCILLIIYLKKNMHVLLLLVFFVGSCDTMNYDPINKKKNKREDYTLLLLVRKLHFACWILSYFSTWGFMLRVRHNFCDATKKDPEMRIKWELISRFFIDTFVRVCSKSVTPIYFFFVSFCVIMIFQ